MKRWVVLLALLPMAGLAIAGETSMRFGSQLVVLGDALGHVLKVAGKPDARVPLQNKFGAAVGERLDYDRDNETVQIFISNGVVIEIEDIRN